MAFASRISRESQKARVYIESIFFWTGIFFKLVLGREPKELPSISCFFLLGLHPLALKEVLGLLQAQELGWKAKGICFFIRKAWHAPLFHGNRRKQHDNNMYFPTCKYIHIFSSKTKNIYFISYVVYFILYLFKFVIVLLFGYMYTRTYVKIGLYHLVSGDIAMRNPCNIGQQLMSSRRQTCCPGGLNVLWSVNYSTRIDLTKAPGEGKLRIWMSKSLVYTNIYFRTGQGSYMFLLQF